MRHWTCAALAAGRPAKYYFAGTLAAMGFALLNPSYASAQEMCSPLETALHELAVRYGETPVPGEWHNDRGEQVVLTGSHAKPGKTATWTMMVVRRLPDESGNEATLACGLAAGTVRLPKEK